MTNALRKTLDSMRARSVAGALELLEKQNKQSRVGITDGMVERVAAYIVQLERHARQDERDATKLRQGPTVTLQPPRRLSLKELGEAIDASNRKAGF